MPEGMTWERHIQVDSAWPRELPQIERGGHGGRGPCVSVWTECTLGALPGSQRPPHPRRKQRSRNARGLSYPPLSKAMAAADDSGIGQTGATTSIRFMVFDQNPLSNEQEDYAARSGLISRKGTKSKLMECDVTGAQQLKIFVSNYGDGFAYDRADLIYPEFIDANGNEISLTTLNPTSYTSEWGSLHVNKNVEGGTLKVEGQSYDTGLGMNAQCTLIYDLPEGHNYKTFRALCGYDSSCDTDNTSSTGTTMEFFFYVTAPDGGYEFDLTQLGYAANEAVPVYDIWQKESLGTATCTLNATIPSHGVKLYRLGDKVAEGIMRPTPDPSRDGGGTDAVYDLQGRRVTEPTRGIYIQNGKKIRMN